MTADTCAYCLGRQWFTPAVESSHPLFGKALPCPACTDMSWQQRYLEQASGLSSRMASVRFADSQRLPHQVVAFEALERVVQDGYGMVGLVGPVGVGKSHLVACACNEMRAAGHVSHYNTTARLLDHLRSAYNPDNPGPDYDGMMTLMQDARCLALDELTEFSPTPWAEEKFRMLLDYRYDRANELVTLLSGNMPTEQWPAWLRSRFAGAYATVVRVVGGDVRGAMKNGGKGD